MTTHSVPGRYAVLTFPPLIPPEVAVEVEALGYRTVWLAGSPPADLGVLEPVLAATKSLTVGSDIVNIWSAPATEVAESFHRFEATYPGRFVLGIGTGHREIDNDYRKPYGALVSYLDELDQAGVPVQRRALAALGPRVLQLAGERSAGALPYLVTPAHTRTAREILGPDALLSVGQSVVLQADPELARATAAPTIDAYLGLTNYVQNLRRLGFTEHDVTKPGTVELIDALIAHGDADTVAARLRAHLDAGADQVALAVLPSEGDEGSILPTLRALAPVLDVRG